MSSKAQEVIDKLKSREPLELKNPVHIWDKALTNHIADLKLHPSIESGLHLLNDDIVSAHFLVRHCQGQAITDYWHGILHRIENDFRNSRLWYQNSIDAQLLSRVGVHASSEDAQNFVWACQNIIVDKNDKGNDIQATKRKAMDEMVNLLDIAISEFGLESRADVSEYYSSKEGDKELKGKMTTGRVKREGHENE